MMVVVRVPTLIGLTVLVPDHSHELNVRFEEASCGKARLAEQRQLLASDRNLSRKRLRQDVLRSSLNVWDGTNTLED